MQIQGFPPNIKIAGLVTADDGSVIEATLKDIVCFVSCVSLISFFVVWQSFWEDIDLSRLAGNTISVPIIAAACAPENSMSSC